MAIYKAKVHLAYGSGGSFVESKNRRNAVWAGGGLAMSKSPKKAIAKATEIAERKVGEGLSWIPIYSDIVLYKDGVKILNKY